MKKSLLATALAAAMVLSTSAVFAAAADVDADAASTSTSASSSSAPSRVKIDGSATFQYRNNSHDGGMINHDKNQVNKTTILLNFNYDLTGGWDVYARASLQAANGGKDFNTNVYDGDRDYAASIDQYGFKYTHGDNVLKIGRQDTWVGQTGLFYDTTGKVGRKIMADGLNYTGKAGAWDYSVIAEQEDGYYEDVGKSHNKLYVGHVNYNFTPDFVLGTTFAKYNLDKDDSYTHADGSASKDSNLWAVNTSYNLGNATLLAEYGKSNYDDDNKAYDFGVGYKFDEKNSVSAIYFRVEDNGDINHWTTFDPNAKGMYYNFTHQFDKATSLSIFYDDAKMISGEDAGKNYDSFRTTLNYLF